MRKTFLTILALISATAQIGVFIIWFLLSSYIPQRFTGIGLAGLILMMASAEGFGIIISFIITVFWRVMTGFDRFDRKHGNHPLF